MSEKELKINITLCTLSNVDKYFNIKKTKIMTTAEWDRFQLDGEEIEVTKSFTFLGSIIEKRASVSWK